LAKTFEISLILNTRTEDYNWCANNDGSLKSNRKFNEYSQLSNRSVGIPPSAKEK